MTTFSHRIRKEPTLSEFKSWVNRQEDIVVNYRHAAIDLAERFERECKQGAGRESAPTP